jgi:hypothetical protein
LKAIRAQARTIRATMNKPNNEPAMTAMRKPIPTPPSGETSHFRKLSANS